MRLLSTFLSIIAVMAAAGMVIRSRVPWPVTAYIVAQCLFALLAWWGLQRGTAVVASRSYLLFYEICFCALMLFALWTGLQMAFRHPTPLAVFLIIGVMVQSAAIAAIAYFQLMTEWPEGIPDACKFAVLQGVVFAFCGTLTLTAVMLKVDPEIYIVALCLGGFWTCMSGASWAYALGITRARSVWIHLNDFLPAFLAIIWFGFMAFQLHGLQAEGSLAVTGHVSQQVPVMEAE